MKYLFPPTFSLVVLFWLGSIASAFGQSRIDVESGTVFPRYIDIRIPGAEGTLFSLSEIFDPGYEVFFRAKVLYTLNNKHTFAVLYAPLTVNGTGKFTQETFFEDKNFGTD